MKIGPLENKSTLATANSERKAVVDAPAAPARVEPSAKVELSAAAGLLTLGEADGAFDAQKIERLAAAIRDGTFRVDADAIADKLIANAQELLGQKSR